MDKIKILENDINYLKNEVRKLRNYKQDKIIDRKIKEGFNLLSTTSLTNSIKIDLSDLDMDNTSFLNTWRIYNYIYYYIYQYSDDSRYIIKYNTIDNTKEKNKVDSSFSNIIEGLVGDYIYVRDLNQNIKKYNYVTKNIDLTITNINRFKILLNNDKVFAYNISSSELIMKYYDEENLVWTDIENETSLSDIINNTVDKIYGSIMSICMKNGKLSGLIFRDESYLYKYKLVKGYKDRLEYCFKFPITAYAPDTCASNNGFLILEDYTENYIIYLNYDDDYYYSFKISINSDYCCGINEISIMFAPYIGYFYTSQSEFKKAIGYSNLEYTYYIPKTQ